MGLSRLLTNFGSHMLLILFGMFLLMIAIIVEFAIIFIFAPKRRENCKYSLDDCLYFDYNLLIHSSRVGLSVIE